MNNTPAGNANALEQSTRRYRPLRAVSRAPNLLKETTMRTAYAFGLAAFLAVSPAMAQVIIGGGDNDAARHEAQAQQDRADVHQDMNQARRDAAVGNYGAAAQEQRDAHHDWRQAQHQQHDADRDSNGGVTVQIR
jgi:hypothetical protein